MVNTFQRSIVVPKIEVAINSAAGRQILRDRPPLASGTQNVHQPIDDIAHVTCPFATARSGWRDQRTNQSPFFIRQIARVAQLAPVVTTPILIRPHRSPCSPAVDGIPSPSKSSTCQRTDTEARLHPLKQRFTEVMQRSSVIQSLVAIP